jgi:hypothetical protein
MTREIKRLTTDQIASICTDLVIVGERLDDWTKELVSAGYSAFWITRNFRYEYCIDDAERQLTHAIEIENAKLWMSTPHPCSFSKTERELLYSSKLIDALSIRLETMNGVPMSQLPYKFPGETWRYHVDPIEQRINKEQNADPVLFELQQSRMRSAASAQVKQEALSLAAVDVGNFGFDASGRVSCFEYILRAELLKHGFEIDLDKSEPGDPVAIKKFGCWGLAFLLERRDSLLIDMNYGNCGLGLYLVPLKAKHIRECRDREFMHFRFQNMIIGFSQLYSRFDGIKELVLCIRAQLTLYGLISPHIEAAVAKVILDSKDAPF